MSDTVLGGNWTVYYGAENRRKAVKWSGGASSPNTVKELYLALQDLFDNLAQMDDGTIISAQTPTEYTIGIIDPGDKDPWFIDRESTEHLVGGAIKTASWKRVEDSNVGIVCLSAANTDIVAGDVGEDITHQDGDAGTLLDFKDMGGGNIQLWIRPDTSAAANSFDSAAGTLTCNTHTATQDGASTTGEMLWANIYALGTLASDTHLYVYQGYVATDTAPDEEVTGYKSSWNWWGDGFFDVLVLVANQSSSLATRSTFIDGGYITVLARQYGRTYTYYIVDLFAGGRNPIPLETGTDLNNTTGYRTVSLSSTSGNFSVGDELSGADTTARVRITSLSAIGTSADVGYYILGNVSIDLSGGEVVSNLDDTGEGTTSGAPADTGPATASGLSAVHAAIATEDIDEDGTPEYYSIQLECNSYALADVYEWAKWVSRDGAASSLSAHTDGIEAEQYIGSDYRIVYNSMGGTVVEGDKVTQDETGAVGTIVALHTTPKIAILRNSRGTFNASNTISAADNDGLIMSGGGGSVTSITPIKACPFGNFAGGVLFAAPGVVPTNYLTVQANNFQLVDDQGQVIEAPIKVILAMTNTRIKDRLAAFRLLSAGGDIEKDYYALSGSPASGSTAFSANPNIRVDEPGKTVGGIVFVIDADGQVEHRYRYTGWSVNAFTLFQTADDTAEDGTTTTVLSAASGFTNALVGDIVSNVTQGAVTYISVKTDNDTVTVYPPVTGQNTGDTFRVGATVAAYVEGDDKIYVPLIHVHETAGTDESAGNEQASIVYDADIPIRVRARHAADAQYNIKPFETDSTVGDGGASIAVIRTPETITS
jgi:hypothetical protein